MAGDWIKMHRKTLESLVNSDAGLMHLWVNLLLRANWKPSWFAKQRIEVGQVAFSISNFAITLKVSDSTLRRRLKELVAGGQIEIKATNQFTTVTICNWSTYQEDAKRSWRTDEQTNGERMTEQAANERRTDDTHPKKLRSKEGKKVIKEMPTFSSDIPGLQAAVDDWLTYKKERHEDYKPTGLANLFLQILKKVESHGADFVVQSIRDAMSSNYQGFMHAFKDERNGQANRRGGKAATGESASPTGSLFS